MPITKTDDDVLSPRRLRVLVGDDQSDVREALRLLLKGAGHQAVTADSPSAVLEAAQGSRFDLVLIDLNYARDTTSGQEGLDLVTALQDRRMTAPIIVMTAWGSVDLAVEAMRRGAADFVQKPWDNQRLLAAIDKLDRQSRKRHSAEQQEKSEWDIARNVQQKLFPHDGKRLDTVDYAGLCWPARQVSGDYYDFLDSGPGRLGFLLADVSGKGIGAALLMANLQAAFRMQTELGDCDPMAMIPPINRQFHASTPPEQYATLFYGLYEERHRRLQYVNCGHPAALLLRAGGEVEYLEATSTVVGLFPTWTGEARSVSAAAGDTLVLCSDGVLEAGANRETDFGADRLVQVVKSCRHLPIRELMENTLEEVRRHEAVPEDDCTLVGLRFC